MTKRICTLLLFTICTLCSIPMQLSAQNGNLSISGKVTDADTGEPLEFVIVQLAERNIWAETNDKGDFSIKNLHPGSYEVVVQSTGYKPYSQSINLKTSVEGVEIKMSPLSLALNEVTVTANAKRMGSTSQIGREAVQHIQPKSLEDMIQLAPGNVTKNPDLNSIGQAQIREIDNNANNAAGTLVVVDGAPMSNDANMQTFTTSRGGSTPSQSTAGKGVDLRLISPDNIESIEVVRGIPSVEYGNLTSGAVIVKSRTGATPWEIKLKADPYSKMAYAGKGFGLSKGGAISVTADYSQSYSDIRQKYIGYDRVTFGLGYG
ncbi:MAG: TonB-dependent receptor, partial [Muribaculaceae bacterium]|nr:TonB-dependent receptor [Muribaculaceae bacterium]